MHKFEKNGEQKASIFIADDDAATRAVLRLLLQKMGFSVVGEASDGEQAVNLCSFLSPDIAFVDVDMPRIDGHQAISKIREQCQDTQVIMISNLPTLNNVKKAISEGACSFVVKPFNVARVADAINHCIKSAHEKQ